LLLLLLLLRRGVLAAGVGPSTQLHPPSWTL
jgi:hypothetical protein